MRIDREELKKYEEIYDECEDDLEFYNALMCREGIWDDNTVQEIMYYVTGANDAYYNALDMMEDDD